MTVKPVFRLRAHGVRNAHMHRKLLRLRADLRSCRAVKIDVRRKIFIAAAGVQIDYALSEAHHIYLLGQ